MSQLESKGLSFSGIEKRVVYSLALLQFTHIVDFMIMMPLGPLLIDDFGINNRQFSYLVSAYTFSAGISALIASMFIDRFARKKALLFIYVGFAAGTLACALSEKYHLLLVARIFTGSFGGMISAMIYSIIGDVFPYQKRGSAMGVIMGAFSFAAVVGVPAGLYFATILTWNAPFYMLTMFQVVCFVVAFAAIPVTRQVKQEHSFFEVYRVKNHYVAFLITFTIVMAGFLMIPYISNYLIFNTEMKQIELPFMYLLGGATTLVTARVFGYLTDRFGKKETLYAIAACSLVPLFLISRIDDSSLGVILVVTTVFFIFISGRLVPYMAMLTSAVEPYMRGSFMTINSATQQVTAAAATMIAGSIIGEGAQNRILHYDTLSYLAAASTLLAMFFVSRLKIYDKQKE